MASIAILSHMARSGGTLVCKCLGVMQQVVLLSEIHPDVSIELNALMQAHQWHHLFSDADLSSLSAQNGIDFADAIQFIHKRVTDLDKVLLIRDWSHVDFTAVPYAALPSYSFSTVNRLKDRFSINHYATVRHPIDQWLSLNGLQIIRGKLTLEDFLLGYRKFAEAAVKIGFVRYEDFVQSPEAQIEKICTELALPFDANFIQNWQAYDKLTGDVIQGERNQGPIQSLPRKPVDEAMLEAFNNNADYHHSIQLLGYQE